MSNSAGHEWEVNAEWQTNMGTPGGGNREDNTVLVVRTPKSDISYGPRPKLVMVDQIVKHVPLFSVIDSNRFTSFIF